MNKYFAYIRVSDPRQGKGVSLAEQEEAIRIYAAQKGIAIVEWFRELETASARGRAVFSRMLYRLERGAADGVIIHKIDRGARNLEDWSNLGRLFDRGIDVQFAHDKVDLKTRGGRLSADIIAVVAADYIRNLREEVKKGFYGRLKQGVYPLPAPVGYLDCGPGIPKAIDPILGPIVQEAFEIYATGSVGLRELRALLDDKGLRSRRGGQFSISGVAKILRNRFYLGQIYLRKTNELYEGRHEPLIQKQIFDRVQSILDGKAIPRQRFHAFPYRRFLRCRSCNRQLSGELQKARYIYYRCHSCPGICIPQRTVDTALERLLRLLSVDRANLAALRDMVDIESKRLEAEETTRSSAVALKRSALDASMARLTEALIEGLIDKQTFEEHKRRILDSRLVLSERVADLNREVTILSALEKFELQNTLILGYETALPVAQREILESISSNCIVAPNRIEFQLLSPYREMVETDDPAYGGPYEDTVRTNMSNLLNILRAQAGLPANDNEPAYKRTA